MGAFLTDIDSIKERGFVNKNVENNIITTTLRRVQDTMLLPILGTTFFKRLLQGVEDSDLTVNETTLLNDYILDFLVACVDYRIVNGDLVATVGAVPIPDYKVDINIYCRFGNSMSSNITYESVLLTLI